MKGWENIFHANINERKGVVTLISDKRDFESKTVINSKYNDKRVNPAKRSNIYKYICTQGRSTKICKTSVNREKILNEKKNRQQYTNIRGF